MRNLFKVLLVVFAIFIGKTSQSFAKLNVGLVLSTGGLGDKSFNDSAYRGLEMAKKDLGINFKAVEPKSSLEDEEFLREYADAGYDYIIGVGFPMRDAIENVARDYPEIKFAMIDSTTTEPNVKNLLFKENEGSFLMGALAALMSKNGVVGFVGGIDMPLINKFKDGYEQGAKYINPNIKVLSAYLGGTNAFNDPLKANEMATLQIKQGADVLYHAAGGSGLGVLEAARDNKIYAIGVDSNQDDFIKGTVLTSMMKNVDIAVYDSVQSILDGKFQGGDFQYGLTENGVGTTDFKNTKEIVGEENINKINEIIEKIKNKEIVVK
ncbi:MULTISPECIES: BMP family lipoprotein [Cetobacterium]|uniref:BMP family ABC transporter substrate-binding protein n=1 Tax=Candidatus Cetobacterium colombiensis TaxID=3073100 RepID=A0ABU4WAV2_9FUSO|nr:BMP family ABC transporter substrate-binding protein [Candidatus Cetobacterium colombiensis]MDX8336646.1 BMP family ABC transporter substrate-binding protein [Candidatus Cetobacterium colombiensis]